MVLVTYCLRDYTKDRGGIKLNSRLQKIYKTVCVEMKVVPINDISSRLKVTERTIYSDIKKLNTVLSNSGYSLIENDKGVLSYSNRLTIPFNTLIRNTDVYVLDNPKIRQTRITLFIFTSPKTFNLEAISDEFQFSRNTLLKDLKVIKENLLANKIKLISLPFTGFKVEGEEHLVRNYFISLLNQDPLYIEDKIGTDQKLLMKIEGLINKVASSLKFNLTDESFEKLVLSILVTFFRISNQYLFKKDSLEVNHTKEESILFENRKTIEEIFQLSIPDDEIIYLASKISEASVIGYEQLISDNWITFNLSLEEFINKVSEKLHYPFFLEDEALFEGLLNHLRPAYKRAQSNESIENPMFDYIIEQHSNIHEVVATSAALLEEQLEVKFSDHEKSFFSLFFAASYERNRKELKRTLSAIVVCAAGISTSEILKSKLESKFHINIMGTFSTRSALDWLERNNVDIIISTVPFQIEGIPCVQVSTYLSEADLEILRQILVGLPTTIDITNLMSIISNHATIQNYKGLENHLRQYLGNELEKKVEKGVYQPMLLEVLTEELVQVNFECLTRDEAVRESGRLLVKKGYAEERYTDAMIQNVVENGTYIVIAPGIAMPHARPEAGALDIGLSIVTLKEPVVFGHPKNDPVRIVVGLCATDHQSHLKALSELIDVLGDDQKINEILEATSAKQILDIIKGEIIND